MRPKKKVLLIDGDEVRQSLTRIVLEVHGFRVFSAKPVGNVTGPSDVFKGTQFDCVLGFWPLDTARAFDFARRRNASLVVVDENADVTANDIFAHRYLSGPEGRRAVNVVAAVKSACSRRRGPTREPQMVYEFRQAVAA